MGHETVDICLGFEARLCRYGGVKPAASIHKTVSDFLSMRERERDVLDTSVELSTMRHANSEQIVIVWAENFAIYPRVDRRIVGPGTIRH